MKPLPWRCSLDCLLRDAVSPAPHLPVGQVGPCVPSGRLRSRRGPCSPADAEIHSQTFIFSLCIGAFASGHRPTRDVLGRP